MDHQAATAGPEWYQAAVVDDAVGKVSRERAIVSMKTGIKLPAELTGFGVKTVGVPVIGTEIETPRMIRWSDPDWSLGGKLPNRFARHSIEAMSRIVHAGAKIDLVTSSDDMKYRVVHAHRL